VFAVIVQCLQRWQNDCAPRWRSDCAVNAQQLRIDGKAIAQQRLRNEFAAIARVAQRLRSVAERCSGAEANSRSSLLASQLRIDYRCSN
jgi:hypothetical protein